MSTFKEKRLQDNRTGFVNKKDWRVHFIVQKLEMGGYQITAGNDSLELKDWYKTKKEIHDHLNDIYESSKRRAA